MNTVTLYEAETSLARAAMGDPHDAHRAWVAGAFHHRLTVDVCVAVLSACSLWIDRGGRARREDMLPLARLVKHSLQLADAWDIDVLSPDEMEPELWLAPAWGATHVVMGVVAMIDTAAAGSAWVDALTTWGSLTSSEAA